MLRGILNAPRMTPKALLYLELEVLPIGYIIKSRRLMFIHYILNQNEESLVIKFFNAQMENSTKADWTSQIKKDLTELEINLEIKDIKLMSKNKFKKHITKKIEIAALKYLKLLIKTKGKELQYKQIEMQDYLKPEASFKLFQKQNIFKMRSRMLYLKENMKGKHFNFKC